MKWIKWGLGAAGALIAGGALTFAVLAAGGTASAQEGPAGAASRFAELLAQRLGISPEQLKTAVTDARNQLIDEMLASGQITQAQAERMRSAPIGEGLGFPGRAIGAKAVRLAVDVVQITARVSNISVETVRAELQQGKSLAQIAAERGVSREALKNAITAEHRAQLQSKVAAGEITQAQANQMLERLSQHIDQLIDRPGLGKAFGGPRGPRGGAPSARPTPSSSQ